MCCGCCPLVQSVDLSVGDLQMYGTVNWLNAADEVGKVKKGSELLTLIFIFKSGVVLLAQERVKGKKKAKVSQSAACVVVDSRVCMASEALSSGCVAAKLEDSDPDVCQSFGGINYIVF